MQMSKSVFVKLKLNYKHSKLKYEVYWKITSVIYLFLLEEGKEP